MLKQVGIIPPIIAILALAYIASSALSHGIDHAIVASVVGAIGILGGYGLRRRRGE